MNLVGTEPEVIRVGIAEGAVVRFPTRLRTTGLGSCVGVVVYDRVAAVGGLVHVMLPYSPGSSAGVPTKFADSGIPWLFEHLVAEGGVAARMMAKLAGGAQMFAFAGKSDIMRVGPRNVEAVKDALFKLRIPIVSEDVGGNAGRTIEFDGMTETLWVRTAMSGSYSI